MVKSVVSLVVYIQELLVLKADGAECCKGDFFFFFSSLWLAPALLLQVHIL